MLAANVTTTTNDPDSNDNALDLHAFVIWQSSLSLAKSATASACAGNQITYTLDVTKKAGQRISDMTLLRTGEKIDAAKSYAVSGWASVNEGTEGPPIHEVVTRYLTAARTIRVEDNRHVRVSGADPRGVMG